MSFPLDRSLKIHVDGELQLVPFSRSGAIAHGHSERAPFDLIEADIPLIEKLLESVRNHGEVGLVLDSLDREEGAGDLLLALVHEGWVRCERPLDEEPTRPTVAILGHGALARAIESHLSERSSYRAKRIELESSASELLGIELVVAALENVSYEAMDAHAVGLNDLPCLYVSYERGAVILGPTSFVKDSSRFTSARRELFRLTSPNASTDAQSGAELALRSLLLQEFPAGQHHRALLSRAAADVVAEIENVLDPAKEPRLLNTIRIIRQTGSTLSTQRYDISHSSDAEAAHPSRTDLRDLALSSDIEVARQTAYQIDARDKPFSTTVRTVGIVGGGTAGYLTALALRKKRPELDVTLIESSKIPVIGVGEATTALLNYFLHGTLGLDILDFYARVRPTWKLGIRFEWGLPGDYFFNSPFQFGRLLESIVYENDINKNCLGSRMMSSNTTPIVVGRDGRHKSLLGEVSYAYHLDNRRFVTYLSEEARRAGVRHVDCVVEAGVPTADGGSIDHLRTDSGEKLSFDMYVDATGFRSLLLGKALGSPYDSYASSLFNDTALVADVPHNGLVKPYTTAETMNHGWCWNIPMEDEDHRGYVYSSAFATTDEVEREMRSKNPKMGAARSIRFQSGRHHDFWKGNTVAIGNSYGFVEPLQSTAIHMVLVEIDKLVRSFPREPSLVSFQGPINTEVGDIWDTLRWFLAAHYRFNRKLDTPYWRECRAKANIEGIAELIDLYRERAPIAGTPHRMKELDHSTFGVYRYDLLFMGMGIPTTYVKPQIDEPRWRRASAACARVNERALLHGPALEALRTSPELLLQHARELASGG